MTLMNFDVETSDLKKKKAIKILTGGDLTEIRMANVMSEPGFVGLKDEQD